MSGTLSKSSLKRLRSSLTRVLSVRQSGVCEAALKPDIPYHRRAHNDVLNEANFNA